MSYLLANTEPSTAQGISESTLNALNIDTNGSHFIASLAMKISDWILSPLGLQHSTSAVTWAYAIVVFAIAFIVGYIAKWITIGAVRHFGNHTQSDLYKYLRQENFFLKLCRMIPAIVFLILIQFTLVYTRSTLANLLTKLTLLYVIYVTAIALSALVGAIWAHFNASRNKRHLPLRGLVQLVRGIICIVAVIIAVAVLVDKSPASLLAGLGAFAAVLMLIFKDSILGLVAGVQLSENDSLHVGDWIKVNGTDANGTVTEVTLTSVKVENWDKTTTMLPPYSLISGSFTNYRSMQVSNTRRIQRSYMIDADSVLPLTPEMLDEFRKIPFMDDFITRKLAQKAAGKVEDVNNSEGLPDGTIDTNLGLFRAYMKMWLDNNKFVDSNSTCFVSTLQQTGGGIPFQIYCFTSTSAWLPYEAMQDTIFEHLAAMLSRFRLYCFEQPSGRDTVIDGFLSPGGKVERVFGMPYPFFNRDASSPVGPENWPVEPKLQSQQSAPSQPASGSGSKQQ